LYRANLVWESLVNSRTQNADSWFQQYTKVSRDFHNESLENCFICARDSIYMMRNSNFRNNQLLVDLYIMGTEAMINLDSIDMSFINEGMTIGIEIPGLAVRKLYCDILTFSRTDRRNIRSIDDEVNNILAMAKDIENRITDRRIATNDIIEYKENRSWIYKCYKLWLRTCSVKTLNPNVDIYQKKQMRNENVSYFSRKENEFKEDEEDIQKKLKERLNQAQLLQEKITNMMQMEKEMENFNPEDYNIPRLMMRLMKSVYPGLANLYDELIKN
jgi:hypothetical protein